MRLTRRGLSAWLCAAFCAAAHTLCLPPGHGRVLATRPQSDVRVDAIRALLNSGDYARAESEAVSLRADVLRTAASTADLQNATDVLVEALCLNGKGAEPSSRALAEEVVQSRIAAVGPDDPSLSNSLRNLGDVLTQAGQYQSAVAPLTRALALREKALGSEHGDIAEDLDHLGRALLWAEHSDEALAVVSRALQIREKTLDPVDARIARSLEVQGAILQRKGEHARARSVLERAVALRHAARSPSPERAAAVSLLGEQLWFEGDIVRAKELCTKALALAEDSLRPAHPELAVYLRRLALPLNDLGDVVRARELRERALDIAQTALGRAHPAAALQMNDLANSLYLQGDYSLARPLFEQALKAYSALGPDSAGATAAAYNLGVVNADLGDYLEAERHYLHAIAVWTRLHGAEHPFVAYGFTALGDLRHVMGRYDEANHLYQQALAVRETKLGPNALDVARTLNSLAQTLLDSGHTALALERSIRAVDIWKRSGALESSGYVDALDLRAAIQARMGDQAAAGASYQEALTMLVRLYGPAHPGLAAMKGSLAVALARGGEQVQAVQTAFEAEQIDRDHVILTVRYLAERQALGYAAQLHRAMSVALSLADQTTGYERQLLDRIIKVRSLMLDEMAARHQTAADAAVPEIANLRTNLIAARQRLANLVVRGPARQSVAQYLALVEDAKRDKEVAERRLAEKSTVFTSEMARPAVGERAVREALPRGTVLLSFYRYDRLIISGRPPASVKSSTPAEASPSQTLPSYVAFVLRSDVSHPTIVPIGDAETIDGLVSRWRAVLTDSVSVGSLSSAERQLRDVGALLRRRVWDPIVPHLGGADRVFVVPDGSLNLVPLSALPVGRAGYLLDRGPTLHYLSTERDLVPPSGPAVVGNGLLVLGAPSFEDPSPFAGLTASAAPDALAARVTFRGSVAECPSFQTLRFGLLPASGKEANEVAGLWKAFGPPPTNASAAPKVLVGRAADERSFKQLSPGHRVLHLATHGFFLGSECASALDGTRSVGGLVARKKAQIANDARSKKPLVKGAPPSPVRPTGENPLLLSGLAMAGANRRAAATGNEEDGILTAEEVASLDLSGVEWAVLSACDTGLGEIKAGEGVFGLRRAFQIAGAHTVIMSLWSVEDRAGMAWMRALYEGRLAKHLDTAAAVRDASLTVLRERRARGQSTHPFYWAGFVASGDWR